MLHAVILTQYRRVTDGRTDGIAVANTALAMRALWRTVKRSLICISLYYELLSSKALRYGMG